METATQVRDTTTRTHIARRLLVGTTLTVALLFTVCGAPADAASFEKQGSALTSSGASVLTMGVDCGLYRANLSLNFGPTMPHYFQVAIGNANTGQWGQWSAWQQVTSLNMVWNSLTTQAGNWRVVVTIAHWNGRAWTYDSEFTFITNHYGLHPSTYCHVGY